MDQLYIVLSRKSHKMIFFSKLFVFNIHGFFLLMESRSFHVPQQWSSLLINKRFCMVVVSCPISINLQNLILTATRFLP